jgi:hypothetical protein
MALGMGHGDAWRTRATLSAVVAALTAGLVVYSQTIAFYGDEGFHLLAALLIGAGKRPYLDFFYQHVPFYTYLAAGWFSLAGAGWRGAHAFSALCTAGAVALVAVYVKTRVPDPVWSVPAAVTAAGLVGLNALVIQSGTVGHPYGLGLLLLMGAFTLTVLAGDREQRWLAAGAGLCAGGAAASSLLAAPALPILGLWLLLQTTRRLRGRMAGWFLTGAAIPFLPLLWLTVHGPRQTWFNILEYHLFYRRESLSETIWSGLRMLASLWLESPQGLLPALLATVGWRCSRLPREWDLTRRAEMALCAGLAVGLGSLAACALPTYPSYFVLMVPFLSILAAIGAYGIGSRVWGTDRPSWMVLLAVGLFALGLAKPVYQMGRDFETFAHRWSSRDDVAQAVNRVTPPHGEVWTDEFIYVAAGRVPPSGLENVYPSELRARPPSSIPIKVVPQAQLDAWLGAGRFDTVAIETEDPRIGALELSRLYSKRIRVQGYEIFWERTSQR